MRSSANSDPLAPFHPAVATWFRAAFEGASEPQRQGWPSITRGASTLILAPTGSGKTLTAFLWCLNRLMFEPATLSKRLCRVLYISPLKALAVDVERNLQRPLLEIARVAEQRGDAYVHPTVTIRTGDTPARDRARFQRTPSDILITTPESLYLLLTSRARDVLRSVDTVILDEIHALVPTKRGAHLALSLERLESRAHQPIQRIGLSATQRPLEEVARFLGGADTRAGDPPHQGRSRPRTRGSHSSNRSPQPSTDQAPLADGIGDEFVDQRAPIRYRPVTVVDAGRRKALALRIEVPVEDMARLSTADDLPSGPASVGDSRPSIWSAIHPRLLEHIRGHRSTLIFVNSRRLAERLAGALNELAGETLVRSHHGSIAREQRLDVEERLKAGTLRALVATSSLELGIDMGAIDLVVQIEAPPSVASGLQRIGRSGHQAGAVSAGIVFPKFRGDLVACAAVSRAMHEGDVEASRYPRNPLDVLAQHLVAMCAVDAWQIDALFATVRAAAPFAALGRAAFEGTLDMLSGRYPSDAFASLRPRLTWDRTAGTIVAREGARQVAIANGGTIPDRGLFGVFLSGSGAGTGAPAVRVGELDEEMVFETQPGETFILGASSWRVDEITHDRVMVSPAPGQPGKMPFWKGDAAGRPMELGLAIGRLMRDLMQAPAPAALERLRRDHDLEPVAAENLLRYLHDQRAATGAVPDAETVVVERVRDELGDWRVCVLSPRGGRIHAPWAMAAAAKIREERGIDVETLWGDDGFVVRFPDVDEPPDVSMLIPPPHEVQALVVRQLGATALFAARFRENAGRSLLLPKRRAGMRAPLWQQRKRSTDLLAVAARYGSFPVLLETYRECLRDVFDMPALVETLSGLSDTRIRLVTCDSEHPSPFAASLLFSYVASYLYDGDAPLAERRAQALAVDQAQLRELLGDAELRDLLDIESLAATERQLQHLDERLRARHQDGVHDLLLSLGDLSRDEVRARCTTEEVAATLDALVAQQRAVPVTVAGHDRFVAIELVARYRDAFHVALPAHLPAALLSPVTDALGTMAVAYARTHAPFSAADFAQRYGLATTDAEPLLVRLALEGRLIEGEFRPGGRSREWTDPEVLRTVRRKSLARLRREVEPVDHSTLGRFLATWQGVTVPRRGLDALLDVVEQLQGAPIAASMLETDVLASRLAGYDPADLDTLVAAGEVVWVGLGALGERDGRVSLYLADRVLALQSPRSTESESTADIGREREILALLATRGATFFGPIHDACGGGYPDDTVKALWALVWRGQITNDSVSVLRAFAGAHPPAKRRPRSGERIFRSRRAVPPLAEGRWTLVPRPRPVSERAPHRSGRPRHASTPWLMATAEQLLARYGVLTREAVTAEGVPGGFSALYPVLQAMEDRGRVRRGYFVAGLGATQFALPAAVDLLRAARTSSDGDLVSWVSAADPANPYGSIVPWPTDDGGSAGRGPTRTTGAHVVIVNGALSAYLQRGERHLLTWIPEAEPERDHVGRAVARALVARAREGGPSPRGMLLEEIDGVPARQHPLARALTDAGFVVGAMGLQCGPPR